DKVFLNAMAQATNKAIAFISCAYYQVMAEWSIAQSPPSRVREEGIKLCVFGRAMLAQKHIEKVIALPHAKRRPAESAGGGRGENKFEMR
ncbi:MAG: hypothetical protein ACK2UI_12545, partial [Anaerolineae bacterium]